MDRLRPDGRPSVDQRDGDRRPVRIPATICHPDGQTIPCILRDMSRRGAKLAVSRRHKLPDLFILSVPGRGPGYPVRRMWQRGDFAGVSLDLSRLPAPDDADR